MKSQHLSRSGFGPGEGRGLFRNPDKKYGQKIRMGVKYHFLSTKDRAAKVKCTALKSGCFQKCFQTCFQESGCSFKFESQIRVLSKVLSNVLSRIRGLFQLNPGAFKYAFKRAFKNPGVFKQNLGPRIFVKHQ